SVDLSIKLPLTERVVVTAKDGGGYDITHAPEPVIDPTWMT
ncbi:phage tail protein, partial [Xanthomonas hortorum]